jgi:hypothetical protein
MYVTNLLFLNSFCKYSFSSFFVAHFELAKNSLMIEATISFSVGLDIATGGSGLGSERSI